VRRGASGVREARLSRWWMTADEVLISTYLPANWLETGIVGRLRTELDIPISHVVRPPGRAAAAAPASR
jgi:hypothetical protein